MRRRRGRGKRGRRSEGAERDRGARGGGRLRAWREGGETERRRRRRRRRRSESHCVPNVRIARFCFLPPSCCFHVTIPVHKSEITFSTISCISKWSGTTFQTNTRFVNRLHTIKTHKRCNEPNITALPPVKLEICLRKHTSNS